MQRPDFIKHISEMPREVSCISQTGESLGLLAMLSDHTGLRHLRIQHELLPPGRRSSSPHAHTTREEFVYVLSGRPDVWIDGHLYPIGPGDSVSFPAGTGITHTFINNSEHDVELLAIATETAGDCCYYPFNPQGSDVPAEIASAWAEHVLGPHDGLPDRRNDSV